MEPTSHDQTGEAEQQPSDAQQWDSPTTVSSQTIQPSAAPTSQPAASSWSPEPQQVVAAWSGDDSAATPPAPQQTGFGTATPTSPVPVVRVLSPVGVEYVFLTISLFSAAIGLTIALLSLVNGQTDFSVLAFPTAALLVSVPVFAFLFLRLKKLELSQPNLRFDPSKRRSTQFTQIASFLVTLFTLIGVVFSVFAKLGGQSVVSIGKVLLDGLVLLVVFGGLLFYYWRDEHRS